MLNKATSLCYLLMLTLVLKISRIWFLSCVKQPRNAKGLLRTPKPKWSLSMICIDSTLMWDPFMLSIIEIPHFLLLCTEQASLPRYSYTLLAELKQCCCWIIYWKSSLWSPYKLRDDNQVNPSENNVSKELYMNLCNLLSIAARKKQWWKRLSGHLPTKKTFPPTDFPLLSLGEFKIKLQ